MRDAEHATTTDDDNNNNINSSATGFMSVLPTVADKLAYLRNMATGMLRALAKLRQANTIHGDIKPVNVMIDRSFATQQQQAAAAAAVGEAQPTTQPASTPAVLSARGQHPQQLGAGVEKCPQPTTSQQLDAGSSSASAALAALHCEIVAAIPTADQIRLIDFGSAVVSSRHVLPLYAQSRNYRAPEVLLGIAPYGPGIDAWSTGLVLAELALGQRVVRATNEIGALAVVEASIAPLPRDLVEVSRKRNVLYACRPVTATAAATNDGSTTNSSSSMATSATTTTRSASPAANNTNSSSFWASYPRYGNDANAEFDDEEEDDEETASSTFDLDDPFVGTPTTATAAAAATAATPIASTPRRQFRWVPVADSLVTQRRPLAVSLRKAILGNDYHSGGGGGGASSGPASLAATASSGNRGNVTKKEARCVESFVGLISRLCDADVRTRIDPAAALAHPFITGARFDPAATATMDKSWRFNNNNNNGCDDNEDECDDDVESDFDDDDDDAAADEQQQQNPRVIAGPRGTQQAGATPAPPLPPQNDVHVEMPIAAEQASAI